MGCLPEKNVQSLKREKERRPSFLSSYHVQAMLQKSKSKILQEDKAHFIEDQDWFRDLLSRNGVPFLNIEKFLESYKHYKIDQVPSPASGLYGLRSSSSASIGK